MSSSRQKVRCTTTNFFGRPIAVDLCRVEVQLLLTYAGIVYWVDSDSVIFYFSKPFDVNHSIILVELQLLGFGG